MGQKWSALVPGQPLAAQGAYKQLKMEVPPPQPVADWTYYSLPDFQKKLLNQESGYISGIAGTGKSFLLTTVFLWCLVHGKNAKAAAPISR